jgi:AcrR family transcriptional regulator
VSSVEAGRRTRLEADDRREQIVTAAAALFADRPYDSVSTGDIAIAAGTTRTNIHHHFGTKRDLFLEIIDRFSRTPLDLSTPPEASVAEALRIVLGRWLDTVEANREIFMTMLHASSSTDPQVSGVLVGSMHAWEGRLTVLLGMDPSAGDHRAMIRAFQSMVSTATAEWLDDAHLTKAQVHELLTRTLSSVGDVAVS